MDPQYYLIWLDNITDNPDFQGNVDYHLRGNVDCPLKGDNVDCPLKGGNVDYHQCGNPHIIIIIVVVVVVFIKNNINYY